MTKEEIKDQTTREVFMPEFDYRALSNGVKVGNIKQRHLEEVLDKAMDTHARQEVKAFAEWLDKQRNEKTCVWSDMKIWGKEDALLRCLDLYQQQKQK